MTNKPKHILSGAGFYAVLLLCLLTVGVSAWLILFRGARGREEPEQAAASASVPVDPAAGLDAGTEDEESGYQEPEPDTHVTSPADIPQETVEMPDASASKADDVPAAAKTAVPAASAAPDLIVSPLSGEVISAFSMDQLQYSQTLADWRTHSGMDISADAGTNVLAACAGTVASVADDPMMGTTVILSHGGGYETVYANLQSKPTVAKGEVVSAGQIIGAVGSTSIAEAAEGPHLHFSVTKGGELVDPQEFLKR
jgi:murein DD-endopeptidase MepM/ murein hydrolase activator NlpD